MTRRSVVTERSFAELQAQVESTQPVTHSPPSMFFLFLLFIWVFPTPIQSFGANRLSKAPQGHVHMVTVGNEVEMNTERIYEFSIRHWKVIAGVAAVGATVAVVVCVHRHYRWKREESARRPGYQPYLSIPIPPKTKDRLSEVTDEEIQQNRVDLDRRYNHLLHRLGLLMENDQMAFTSSSAQLASLPTSDPFELSGSALDDHIKEERRRNLLFCAAYRHSRVPVLAKLIRTEDYAVEQIMEISCCSRRQPNFCFLL